MELIDSALFYSSASITKLLAEPFGQSLICLELQNEHSSTLPDRDQRQFAFRHGTSFDYFRTNEEFIQFNRIILNLLNPKKLRRLILKTIRHVTQSMSSADFQESALNQVEAAFQHEQDLHDRYIR